MYTTKIIMMYDLGKKNRVKLRETIENEPKMFFYASNSKKYFLCGLINTLPQCECGRTVIGMDFYVLWKLTSLLTKL